MQPELSQRVVKRYTALRDDTALTRWRNPSWTSPVETGERASGRYGATVALRRHSPSSRKHDASHDAGFSGEASTAADASRSGRADDSVHVTPAPHGRDADGA